jgi:hypothetical protein
LEAYQQFLLDSDTLVQNSGRLASAWAFWLYEQQAAQVAAQVAARGALVDAGMGAGGTARTAQR